MAENARGRESGVFRGPGGSIGRYADLVAVKRTARILSEDITDASPIPNGFNPGTAYAAAERLGVPGLPPANGAITLESLKQLGRACRAWLA